jgi:hypothetical protein
MLGLDEATLSWWQLSFCRGMDLNLFYEDYEADEELAKAMDEVCLSCPVMKDCLMDGTDRKDSGLRGAIYLNNGKPDKMRNQHKTPEVWARIQERLS